MYSNLTELSQPGCSRIIECYINAPLVCPKPSSLIVQSFIDGPHTYEPPNSTGCFFFFLMFFSFCIVFLLHVFDFFKRMKC